MGGGGKGNTSRKAERAVDPNPQLPGVQCVEVLEYGLQEPGQLVRQAGCFDDDPRLGGVDRVGELGQVSRVNILHHGLEQAHHQQVQQHAVLQASTQRGLLFFYINDEVDE